MPKPNAFFNLNHSDVIYWTIRTLPELLIFYYYIVFSTLGNCGQWSQTISRLKDRVTGKTCLSIYVSVISFQCVSPSLCPFCREGSAAGALRQDAALHQERRDEGLSGPRAQLARPAPAQRNKRHPRRWNGTSFIFSGVTAPCIDWSVWSCWLAARFLSCFSTCFTNFS